MGNVGHYPKVRLYRMGRDRRTQERQWYYEGSTTHFPTADAALRAYKRVARIPESVEVRAYAAATHGYWIEVD